MKKYLFAYLLLFVGFLACDKDDPTVTSISIQDEIVLDIGDSKKVDVAHDPSTLSAPSYVWQTSDENIFTVDNSGYVTALNVGEATITVKANELNLSSSGRVKVMPIKTGSLTLTPTKVELTMGESVLIKAEVLPENVTDKTIKWKSSNEKIAAVSDDGMVEAVGLGKVTITATSGEATATCEVSVSPIKVEKIILSEQTLTLDIGSDVILSAEIKPDDATDKTIIWSSENDDVATVSDKGLVSAVGVGEVIITATSGDVTATCEVTVNPIRVDGVSLSAISLVIEVSEDATLVANITPENATNKKVVWSSEDKTIATVSGDGVVSGVSAGKTVVTATTEDGGFYTTCEVEVNNIMVKNIFLGYSSLSILPTEIRQITAEITPSNAFNKKLIWSSSNPEVATVSEDGLVEAIEEGIATITVESEDGGANATCDVYVEDITSFISLSFIAYSIANINGFITGDLYSAIENNSNQDIELMSFDIYDGHTGKLVGYSKDPNLLGTLSSYSNTNLGMKFNSVYYPIFQWKFKWNNTEYEIQHQYTGYSTRSTTVNTKELNLIN